MTKELIYPLLYLNAYVDGKRKTTNVGMMSIVPILNQKYLNI